LACGAWAGFAGDGVPAPRFKEYLRAFAATHAHCPSVYHTHLKPAYPCACAHTQTQKLDELDEFARKVATNVSEIVYQNENADGGKEGADENGNQNMKYVYVCVCLCVSACVYLLSAHLCACHPRTISLHTSHSVAPCIYYMQRVFNVYVDRCV